jgi:hypothetical protein
MFPPGRVMAPVAAKNSSALSDDPLPPAHLFPMRVGDLRTAQRVRRIEILDHQRVFDSGANVQEQDGVLARSQFGGRSARVVATNAARPRVRALDGNKRWRPIR